VREVPHGLFVWAEIKACAPYDIRILPDVLKSTKEALRKDARFRKDAE